MIVSVIRLLFPQVNPWWKHKIFTLKKLHIIYWKCFIIFFIETISFRNNQSRIINKYSKLEYIIQNVRIDENIENWKWSVYSSQGIILNSLND